MDNQMPKMGGIETCIKIREQEKVQGIEKGLPVVLISGDMMAEEVLEKSGINEGLLKPCSVEKICDILNKYMLP